MLSPARSVPAALLALMLAGPLHAQGSETDPGMGTFFYARGADSNSYGLRYFFKPPCECEFLTRYNLDPRLGVSVAYWQGLQPDNPHPTMWDVGGHGFLRYFWHPDLPFQPFAEVALGIHLLSSTQFNTNRDFGTHFQFGSRAGIGAALDAARRYEVVLYIEHISNASLASPNDGITFKGIEFRMALR